MKAHVVAQLFYRKQYKMFLFRKKPFILHVSYSPNFQGLKCKTILSTDIFFTDISGLDSYCQDLHVGLIFSCMALMHRDKCNLHVLNDALSHKDWEPPNSQIWLAQIDIENGLDFLI